MSTSKLDRESPDKISRILSLYTKLRDGRCIHAAEEAACHNVTIRSIQRDIKDIQEFLQYRQDEELEPLAYTVVYDRRQKGYVLKNIEAVTFSNSEILAICKILLDSRAFTKPEMTAMLDKLVTNCVAAENQDIIRELIKNEAFHYIEPHHKTVFIDKLWTIGQAIKNHQCIEITYKRSKDKKFVTRKLQPAAIMFSEYYFYLTAFIDDKDLQQHFDVINDSFPTIYRVDRIASLTVLPETFRVLYADRFQEGEFRKRVQFMYGGRLKRIRFIYTGPDVEAILDRLPTAIIEKKDGKAYTISAEVFGDGINMWLRSQGKNIQLLNE
ncbi:helix-turn-helix transcriptional regulator [Megasphaera stantonii]|uniref:WYL domain-containing transcriptional regulator n=1 Tax=Megasphaera stantonii TaxID=2144175 RepID=A0A346AY07_9FIRM|nr:WYL domain-containing protein [Megasphaera stantonii]AXL20750.1 WYL domain-containing transcriptional regulator [Megasphaera stantonii]